MYVGTDVDANDFLAVVGVDPDSGSYAEIVDRVEVPDRGDELHHFGWNACSSSCHVGGLERRHLVVPGQRSSRIHVVDAKDRRSPELETVIEPEEVFDYDLSAPHTVHCIPAGQILISMLGDADGELPGGFLQLDESDFSIEGTGACETCTARLLEETVSHRRPPRALKDRHVEAGYVLTCVAVPRGDCRLRVGPDVLAETKTNPWK